VHKFAYDLTNLSFLSLCLSKLYFLKVRVHIIRPRFCSLCDCTNLNAIYIEYYKTSTLVQFMVVEPRNVVLFMIGSFKLA
jgi:hypothetical protein